MPPPDPALMALHQIGVIRTIEIDYRHMHSPRGGTYVRLHGNLGSIDGRWDEYRQYLDVRVEWNSVAKIKPKMAEAIEAWWLVAAEESKEYAEYEKLKKKFEKV